MFQYEQGRQYFFSFSSTKLQFLYCHGKVISKKKGKKQKKSRIFRCHTIFTLREEHYLNNWGEGVHVASESSKHSLIFFFFVARVLKSKDIQTIDEQYHLEITMGMVGWVKWDAGEWKRVRHFVLLKMQNKNVPTFVFFSFKWKSMISFTSQDWAIQSISSFLPSF